MKRSAILGRHRGLASSVALSPRMACRGCGWTGLVRDLVRREGRRVCPRCGDPARPAEKLRRGVSVRQVNPVRRRRLHERNFGEKGEWIRSLPCLRCRGVEGVQAAHVRKRGMGGCGGDKSSLVPLCGPRGCHAEQEPMTVAAYLALTGIDLLEEARELEERWQTMQAG